MKRGTVDIAGMSLGRKLEKITNMALVARGDTGIKKLAKALKTPDNVYLYIKRRVRYKKEARDTLYHPLLTLKRGVADCEDLSATLAALVMALGYPVRFIIIANGTRHIYPLVFARGKWVRYDLTPNSAIIPGNYRLMYDKEVHPNGQIINRHTESEEISDVSGIEGLGRWVDLPPDADVKPGDMLRLYLVPKWYLPTWLETWICEKIMSHKHPEWEITSITRPTKEYHRYIIEIKVLGPPQTSGLGFVFGGTVTIPLALVTASILGGGLLAYLTIDKIQKYVPPMAVSSASIGFAAIGGALLLANLAKFMPKGGKK